MRPLLGKTLGLALALTAMVSTSAQAEGNKSTIQNAKCDKASATIVELKSTRNGYGGGNKVTRISCVEGTKAGVLFNLDYTDGKSNDYWTNLVIKTNMDSQVAKRSFLRIDNGSEFALDKFITGAGSGGWREIRVNAREVKMTQRQPKSFKIIVHGRAQLEVGDAIFDRIGAKPINPSTILTDDAGCDAL